MECMDSSKGGGVISENSSAESDIRYKSDLNETADQYIVWNHSTRGDF